MIKNDKTKQRYFVTQEEPLFPSPSPSTLFLSKPFSKRMFSSINSSVQRSAFFYHDWRQQYHRMHLFIMPHDICKREASAFGGKFTMTLSMWKQVKLVNLHVDLSRANIFAK